MGSGTTDDRFSYRVLQRVRPKLAAALARAWLGKAATPARARVFSSNANGGRGVLKAIEAGPTFEFVASIARVFGADI